MGALDPPYIHQFGVAANGMPSAGKLWKLRVKRQSLPPHRGAIRAMRTMSATVSRPHLTRAF